MAHVAVVGKPSRQRFQTSNTLQMQLGTQISIYTSLREVLPAVGNESVQLVIMLEETVSDQILTTLDEVSNRYPNLKLICVAKDLPSSAREQFRLLKLGSCMLMDYTHEFGDLLPISKKMLLAQPVYVRKSYRYKTSQVSQIMTTESRQNSVVKIMDMSQSGLKARYRNLRLKVGEVVHLIVAAADGTRNHRILAKVAWVNASNREFGVAFEKVSLETATLRFTQAG